MVGPHRDWHPSCPDTYDLLAYLNKQAIISDLSANYQCCDLQSGIFAGWSVIRILPCKNLLLLNLFAQQRFSAVW